MTLAQVHATPGVAAYMAEVEAGLARAIARRPGLAREVAGEALSAGGKRLRPLLCFLTARGAPSVAAGVSVETSESRPPAFPVSQRWFARLRLAWSGLGR